MTKTIALISGKGGVGKTTTAANLGAALSLLGKEVVVVDGNLTTPNLSIHLGIPLYPVTLHDVLRGKAGVHEAVYRHRTGLKVVPADLSVNATRGIKPEKLKDLVSSFFGTSDFVLIDGAAGLGREALAAAEAADRAIVVTNPEITAVTDALKTIRTVEDSTEIMGLVVNRVGKHSHELKVEEIEEMTEYPVLSKVPEDPTVPKSISLKVPVVHFSPKSKAAREFRNLAERLTGLRKRRGFFSRIFGWLR